MPDVTILQTAIDGAFAMPSGRTAVALATAFALGTIIGLERQWRQRTAGLRTNVLVSAPPPSPI